MKKSANTRTKPTGNAPSLTVAEPTREQITAAAHQLWEQNGRPYGRDVEHWLEAERLLREGAAALEANTGKQP